MTAIQSIDKVATSTRYKTDEGFLRGSAALTRSGLIRYKAKELKLDNLPPDQVVTVYRKPEHVFNDTTYESIRGAVVTLTHPAIGVTPNSWQDQSVGSVVGDPVKQGDLLVSDIMIGEKSAINKVEKENWDELSVGYSHDIVKAGKNAGYDYETSQPLTINHVAIVERGRAGGRVRIFDEQIEPEENDMTGITRDQLNDAISDALDKRDSHIERTKQQQDEMEQTIKDTVISTLKDALPDILHDLAEADESDMKGGDPGYHRRKDASSQSMRKMGKRKLPFGKMDNDEQDEEDNSNFGREKMMKRKRKLPYDGKDMPMGGMGSTMKTMKPKFKGSIKSPDSGDHLDHLVDAYSDHFDNPGDIARAILQDEMGRMRVMKKVSHLLTDEEKSELVTADTQEILAYALSDHIEDSENRSEDYLLACLDMMQDQVPESNVMQFDNFRDMPRNQTASMRSGKMRNRDSDDNRPIRVVGQDAYGDITEDYANYEQELRDSWMDEEDRKQG